ncbi:hypothetical protein LG651_06715 [Tamlana sp. 62-3]|uniref:Uncharacterized protein n=1 Tax=Neotamlana sargassicola TaxID=2883125 RepID=A0A9X1I7W0_9FLAO|nr:hypothetical protein [Tamlana sargassicola]MCB4807939.1 hypothetical protein [Tamlana sargassicola]
MKKIIGICLIGIMVFGVTALNNREKEVKTETVFSLENLIEKAQAQCENGSVTSPQYLKYTVVEKTCSITLSVSQANALNASISANGANLGTTSSTTYYAGSTYPDATYIKCYSGSCYCAVMACTI